MYYCISIVVPLLNIIISHVLLQNSTKVIGKL